MSCGVPCVVTDVGDSALMVGSAGIVVPPRDPEALRRGILHVLDMDDSERRRLGLAGRQRVAEEYSMRQAAQRYESLYLELVGRSAEATGHSVCAG